MALAGSFVCLRRALLPAQTAGLLGVTVRCVSYELIVERLHIIVIQFSSWQLKAIGSLLHFLAGEVGVEKARD